MLRQHSRTRACPRCGELHKRNHTDYCSIACEEGRTPLPQDDPRSGGYHLHLQANPQELIGETLFADGFKYSDQVTEDWHKSSDDLPTVWISDEREELIYKTTALVGTVKGFDESGRYIIEKQYHAEELLPEKLIKTNTKRVPASDVIQRIKNDTWWVEG